MEDSVALSILGWGSFRVLFSAAGVGVSVGVGIAGGRSGCGVGALVVAADCEFPLGRPLGLGVEDVLGKVVAGMLVGSAGTSMVGVGGVDGTVRGWESVLGTSVLAAVDVLG